MELIRIVVFTLATFKPIFSYDQKCFPIGQRVGLNITSRSEEHYDNSSIYILKTDGGINCYGLIEEWRFKKSCCCEEIYFQVWRESSPHIYTLIGQNLYSKEDNCSQTGASEETYFKVPINQRIAVEPNDVIGWYQINNETGLLNYDIDSSSSSQVLRSKVGYESDKCQFYNTTNRQWLTCAFKHSDALYRFYSLQAVVRTGVRPRFDNVPSRISVYENANRGVELYQVVASHTSNSALNQNLRFNIAPIAYNILYDHSHFTIDQKTGLIINVLNLNFEKQEHHNISLEISAQMLKSVSFLELTVLDVNEPHVFTNLPNEIVISAMDCIKGQKIFSVYLNDPDKIPSKKTFNIDNYSILSKFKDNFGLPFGIDLYGDITCEQDLRTWIGSDTFSLLISATDFVHRSEGLLVISIVDLQKPPSFGNLNQLISLNENIAIGQVIFKVLPISSIPVTSRLVHQKCVKDNKRSFIFKLNKHDHTLCTTSSFDIRTCDKYEIQISLTNSNGQTSLQNGILSIQILWINSRPRFRQNQYYISIPERLFDKKIYGPKEILKLNVEDRDLDIVWTKENLSCHLNPSSWSKYFSVSVDCNSLKIVESIAVDKRVRIRFNLSLVVTDRFGLTNTADVSVGVYDINDHSPLFSQNQYRATIKENSAALTDIILTSASDLDSGRSGEFVFFYRDKPGQIFLQVNNISGLVTTKEPVDYELYTELSITVGAIDFGDNRLTGLSKVVVSVTDVNDSNPEFICSRRGAQMPYSSADPCFYNVELKYTTALGFEVLQLYAHDVDTVSPNVSYFFLEPHSHFTLEPVNGVILVANKLLYDHKYLVHAYANDSGTPPLISRPVFIRIDTYNPVHHLVDIVLNIRGDTFNTSVIQSEFLLAIRAYCFPWFVQIEAFILNRDTSIVRIYALKDNSSFLVDNLDKPKQFVYKYDLLNKLTKDFFGEPKDDLKSPPLDKFKIKKIVPSYIDWWIDTVPGLITSSILTFFLLVLLVTICICVIFKYKRICTFRKRTTKVDSWTGNFAQEKRNKPRRSIESVHSFIYNKDGNL